MADTFLGAIRDYLPPELHTRAADDLALIRAFIAPASRSKDGRKGLREALVREGSTKAAAEAQVRRWLNIGTGKQQRGATGFAKGKRGDVIRGRVTRALLRRSGTPVLVHYRGHLRFSQKWYTKGFTAPQGRKAIRLEELQDILKLARAVEKEDDAAEAETVARNVLVGFWMGDPSDDAQLKAEYGIDLPYREDVEAWADLESEAGEIPDEFKSEFTIEQAEGGA